MRTIVILPIHLLVTLARLTKPGGARSISEESVLVKNQLLIPNRSRQRSPNLRVSDRIAVRLRIVTTDTAGNILQYETNMTSSATVRMHLPQNDFDGDEMSDLGIFRPSAGGWKVLPSISPDSYQGAQWGSNTDIPVSGDDDGDGKTDLAVWRPGVGTWYILKSSTPVAYSNTQWGLSTDTPAPADYDGDGRTDITVWRPGTGVWYILPTGTPGTYTETQWGTNGDTPVSGDFDGDGKADIAVWRPSTGVWYIKLSGTPGSYTARQWGMAGDMPISSLTGILNSIP
jgi:hypothetical protein